MIETISDAMTARELMDACRKFSESFGPGTSVTALTSEAPYHGGDMARLIVTPANTSKSQHFRAFSWPEAFQAAHVWASTHKAVRRNAIVRRMALAVIGLTDEHGACTETLLRGKDFTAGEIVEFHEAACVRAGEMAGNTPFSVVF